MTATSSPRFFSLLKWMLQTQATPVLMRKTTCPSTCRGRQRHILAKNERLVTLLPGECGCDIPVAGITAPSTRVVGGAHPRFPRGGVTNLSFLAKTGERAGRTQRVAATGAASAPLRAPCKASPEPARTRTPETSLGSRLRATVAPLTRGKPRRPLPSDSVAARRNLAARTSEGEPPGLPGQLTKRAT